MFDMLSMWVYIPSLVPRLLFAKSGKLPIVYTILVPQYFEITVTSHQLYCEFKML